MVIPVYSEPYLLRGPSFAAWRAGRGTLSLGAGASAPTGPLLVYPVVVSTDSAGNGFPPFPGEEGAYA